MRDGGGPFRFVEYLGHSEAPIEVSIRCGQTRISVSVSVDGALDHQGKRPMLGVEEAAEVGHTESVPALRIADARAGDLSVAIDSWLLVLKARGKKPGSIRCYRQTIAAAAKQQRWSCVADLTYESIMGWLAERRQSVPWKGSTYNRNLVCFRSLTRHLHVSGRLETDPLAHELSAPDDGEDGARAATIEEARAFIRAAWIQQETDKRSKGNRALYWLCLFAHACRSGEPDQWCRRHLILDESIPVLRWTPEINKNHKRLDLVIAPELAELLRRELAADDQDRLASGLPPAGPDDPVFRYSPPRPTFRRDRDRAGIMPKDRRGRPFSGHSARKFFSTHLTARGVPQKMVDYLMRHNSSVEARYFDPTLEEQAEAISRMPRLWPEALDNLGGSQISEKALDDRSDGGILTQATSHVHLSNQLVQDRGPQCGLRGVASSGPQRPAVSHEKPEPPAGAPTGPLAGLIRAFSDPEVPKSGYINADRTHLADLFEALAGLLRESGRASGKAGKRRSG